MTYGGINMLLFKNPVRMTSDEAANKYPNSAILMINTKINYRNIPTYGRAMSGLIGDLVAVADNNEDDLAQFNKLIKIYSKPESKSFIFYNVPYEETLEEYMENFKK